MEKNVIWKYIGNLGKGGFGCVDLYHHIPNNTLYAVKFMQNNLREEDYQRFVREVNILKQLTHKNIVKILDYNIQNPSPHYIMPFYENGSLRKKLNESKVFTVKYATDIILKIAKAMQYAHSKGAIHRDLKPENILLDGDEPIIADWGIGKFIHYQSVVLTNQGIGTKGYCSPEQWNNRKIDHRSDIYSLGIIFRELLTGSIDGHIQDKNIRNIVIKMTNENANDRYQSMQEVENAISSINTTPSISRNNNVIKFVISIAAILLILLLITKSTNEKI